MTLSIPSTHRLIELASLNAQTEQLWRALPRGVRIGKDRFLQIADLLGIDRRAAVVRRNVLVRRGFLEEIPVRDGTGSFDHWEWRVRE